MASLLEKRGFTAEEKSESWQEQVQRKDKSSNMGGNS